MIKEIKTTNCECSKPGYCKRHCIHRDEASYRMCSTSQIFFNIWERKTKQTNSPISAPSPAPLNSERKLIYQGVGTELKKLISWFPVKHHTCNRCQKLEQIMNEWGPDKCYEQMDYILHYMEITARQSNILWNHTAVKLLILAAIRLSR